MMYTAIFSKKVLLGTALAVISLSAVAITAPHAFAADCANGTSLTSVEFYTAYASGKITINIVLDQASNQTRVHLINNTGCTAPISIAEYKMVGQEGDYTLSNQVYYAGTPLYTMQANSTADYYLILPNCKTQIDFYYGLAPRILDASNPYACTAGHDVCVPAYAYSNTPWCTVPIPPLTCSPATQTINVNGTANFSATGGNGTFSWSAPTGSPVSGNGANFATTYGTSGSKTATVTSGTQSAQCNVVVNEPAPATLSCSPINQTTNINTSVSFSAIGGNGTYAWSVPTGSPASGNGSSFASSFANAGSKTATVTSGTQSAQCNVVVNDNVCTPANTQTLFATNITQTSATLNGLIDTQGKTASYYFAYGANATLGQTTPTQSANGNNISVSATITNLQPNTTYFFRLVANNSCNDSQGALLTLTTTNLPPLTCSPATQTINVNGTANFSATGGNGTFSWSAPTGSPVSGNGANFATTYGTSGSKTATVTSGTQSAQCNVVVNDNVCTPASAQTLPATNVAQGYATLNGTINPQNKSVTYYFEYGTNTNFGNATPTQSLSASNGNVPVSSFINNLQPNTTYFFRLVVSSDCGITRGDVLNFITPGIPTTALGCNAQAYSLNVNDAANFYAWGGNGTFSWFTSDGSPSYGNGTNFITRFSNVGTKTITVNSNGQSAQCMVTINGNSYSYSNFEITKLVLNRTLNQTTFATNAEAQSLDTLEFEIRVRNTGNNSISMTLRDILPQELSYVFGTTQINGSSVGDGITAGGISLGTLNPYEEKIVRVQATVIPGTTPRTITNQASAIMNGDVRNAFATITIRSRGQVLGVSDVVTGPEDVLPWVLVLGLLGSSLSYRLFFRRPASVQNTEKINAPIVGSITKEQQKIKNELDAAIAEIRAKEGVGPTHVDY